MSGRAMRGLQRLNRVSWRTARGDGRRVQPGTEGFGARARRVPWRGVAFCARTPAGGEGADVRRADLQ
jgi:hypothetical protein